MLQIALYFGLSLIVILLLLILYFYGRVNVSAPRSIDYYTNYIFVYKRAHDGSLFKFFPDWFPFLRDRILWGVDPWSFEYVGGRGNTAQHIYRDKRHIIYGGRVIRDSDVDTFVFYPHFNYGKDSRHVYYDGWVSQKIDPATFEMLGCDFWRDRRGVYSAFVNMEEPIETIDKDTFEIIDPPYFSPGLPCTARDKNHLYRHDINGFQVLE
jgi:hypothetical protein